MARRVDTRARMVEGANELVRVDGFNATSFKDVWEHTGTPRGSVYFHFPGGKEQLGADVVESARATLVALTEAAGTETRTPATFLKRLSTKLADRLEESEYRAGCPIAAVALEMSASSPVLRAATSAAFLSWGEAITAELQRKALPPARARALGQLAVPTLEGALLIAKTHGDRAPLIQAGALLATSAR